MIVRCVSNNFPQISTTSDKKNIGDQALFYPKIDEELLVDEVLGDFYRFDKYDAIDSFNWWHRSRFVEIKDDGLGWLFELHEIHLSNEKERNQGRRS